MTTIAKNQYVTVISNFQVNPGDQDRLLNHLVDAFSRVISKQPGFIAANFHKSQDGTKVVNYAQWESREDFYAYLEKPMAWATVREALKLGHAEYNVYDVYEIVEKDPGGGVETRVVEPSAVNSVRQ
ncbi:MAG: antibiotic biosynthesis monooxygenase [Planctomycetales bacterium]|nr:antibiotic biosynthesis monooxygenase [bacterium]UNM09656.1 MAG: antibiotic biosynthesis monooxygenase [Planctomycetales bacterium]